MNASRQTPKGGTVTDGPNQLTGYSDLARVMVTPEEVIFHFGLRREDEPNEAIGFAKIFVSLHHAKRIASVLLNGIKEHEGFFGEIEAEAEKRLTPEGREKIDQLKEKETNEQNS
jgi:hypothetical protein